MIKGGRVVGIQVKKIQSVFILYYFPLFIGYIIIRGAKRIFFNSFLMYLLFLPAIEVLNSEIRIFVKMRFSFLIDILELLVLRKNNEKVGGKCMMV